MLNIIDCKCCNPLYNNLPPPINAIADCLELKMCCIINKFLLSVINETFYEPDRVCMSLYYCCFD